MNRKRLCIMVLPFVMLVSGTANAGWNAENVVAYLVDEARATGRMCGDQYFPAVAPLTYNRQLGAAAHEHAMDMQTNGYFSHTSRDGRQVRERTRHAGYRNQAVAENIARGQQTAEHVVAAWLKSPDHCQNIMSADFDEVGVGVANEDGPRPIWVLNFGRQQGGGYIRTP